MNNLRNLFITFALALIGCSGGGGGNDTTVAPIATEELYQGERAAAQIDSDNAESIFLAFRRMVGPPSLAPLSQDPQVNDSSILSLVGALAEFGLLRTNLPAPSGTAVDQTENCSQGGQLRVAGTVATNQNDNTLSLSFFNCTEESVTVDGSIDIRRVSLFSEAGSPTNGQFTLSDLTFSDGIETIGYTGNLSCFYGTAPEGLFDDVTEFNRRGSPISIDCRNIELLVDDGGTQVFWLQDFRVADISWRGYPRGQEAFILPLLWRTFAFSGRFYHPDFGYVDVSDSDAQLPLSVTDYETELVNQPSSMRILLNGEASSIRTEIVADENSNVFESTPRFRLIVNGSILAAEGESVLYDF